MFICAKCYREFSERRLSHNCKNYGDRRVCNKCDGCVLN